MQRAYLAVLGMLIVGGAVSWWSSRQPNTYQAAAQVAIGVRLQSLDDIGSQSDDAVVKNASKEANTSIDMARRFANQGVPAAVSKSLVAIMPGMTTSDVAERVHIAQVPDQPQLTITADASSSLDAVRLANTASYLLVNNYTLQIIEPYEERLAKLRQDLDSQNTKIKELEDQIASASARNLPTADLYAMLSQEQQDLAQLTAQIVAVQRERTESRPQFWVGSLARSATPLRPGPVVEIAVAGFAGLLVGAGLALLLGLLDGSIRSEADLKRLAAVEPLGTVPELIDETDGHATLTPELYSRGRAAFELVCQNLRFLDASRHLQTLLIAPVETEPNDDWTALNIAVTYALGGDTTLLIDAGWDKPVLTDRFQVPDSGAGFFIALASVVQDPEEVMKAIQATSVPQLAVMTRGPIGPNVTELLESDRLFRVLNALRAHFKHIIIRSPSIAPGMYGLHLAGAVDAVLLVARRSSVAGPALAE